MSTVGNEQAETVDTLVLDCAASAPFEIGARLDALLCYPTWSAKRQQVVADAICAELMAYSIELEPDRRANLWAEFPQYKKSRSRASLKSLPARRDEALLAGHAFLPLLKKAATGELPSLNGREGELSLSQIARFLWPAEEEGLEIDYEDRLHDRMRHGLRRFYRIAHLAAAYQYIAHERSGAEKAAAIDYQDLDLHRAVVGRSNEYAGYFRSIPRLAKIANGLIDIEWHE